MSRFLFRLNALRVRCSLNDCASGAIVGNLKSDFDDMFSGEFHRYQSISSNNCDFELEFLSYDSAEELEAYIESNLSYLGMFSGINITVDDIEFVG